MGMFVDEPQVGKKLRQIIARLTACQALQDDLLQEALMHLWQTEREHPGRTESWYIQSCRFAVLHRLSSGRSIDSPKRANASNRISLAETDSQSNGFDFPGGDDVVDNVSFKDLQTVLSQRLTPREHVVFEGLVSGLRLREIASVGGLSYPTVLKYRRRIATLVNELARPSKFANSKITVLQLCLGAHKVAPSRRKKTERYKARATSRGRRAVAPQLLTSNVLEETCQRIKPLEPGS